MTTIQLQERITVLRQTCPEQKNIIAEFSAQEAGAAAQFGYKKKNASVYEQQAFPDSARQLFSNFFVREQLLATFRKTSTFLVTFGLF